MESDDVPMEVAEEVEVDTDWSQLLADCLDTPVILRTVLQHFSTPELLQLSLVNSRWNFEARSVLRDRRSLTKILNTNSTCQDLRPFASDLKRLEANSQLLPLSGLTIILGGFDWRHGAWCTETSTEEMNQAYEDILYNILYRHLSVIFNWQWTEEFQICPGFLLMKKILENFGPFLEELSLGLPETRSAFIQQCIQGCCYIFPRLKFLTIRCLREYSDDHTNLIKAVVSRAPNLKVLRTSGWVNLSANLLEGSSAVLVTDHSFSLLNQIPEFVVGRLRMKNMELLAVNPGFNVERFKRITSAILQDSRKTLSSLHIDVVFLVPLTCYGVCLENMGTLVIHMDHQKLETTHPSVLRLLKSFDFTRILPKLTAVKLFNFAYFNYTTNGISELVEQGNAEFNEPMTDRAVKIKELVVDGSRSVSESATRFFAEMFPDIETLSIQGTKIPFSIIFEYWRDLKVFQAIDLPTVTSWFQNLDSVFCGIFPEEVAELRKQDNDYLARVNIVPVMPSITCLKGLRNLYFLFGPSPMEDEDEDPTYLFSKVACLVAFKRCPALNVYLKTSELHRQRAMRSLERYVYLLS